MSCGCNNNYGGGWGGCGCANTVQYAPPACNPNFPTSCTALGAGTIQRIVGEDSAYCKYTVPTLSSNSILFYNASTAVLSWADGSAGTPIFLGNGSGQATTSSSCQIQATTPTGQLVTFKPSTSTETQFPVVTPSGTTTNWGTIENIIPNQGIVYKTGSTADGSLAANTVYQLTGTAGQYVSFDSLGNPVSVAPTLNSSYTYVTGTYIATAGQRLAANTSAGGFTITLPSAPNSGAIVTIADGGYYWGTNNLTIAPASGSSIQGSVQNLICNVNNSQVTLYYNGITWVIIIG